MSPARRWLERAGAAGYGPFARPRTSLRMLPPGPPLGKYGEPWRAGAGVWGWHCGNVVSDAELYPDTARDGLSRVGAGNEERAFYGGYLVAESWASSAVRDRAIACVNACEGLEIPTDRGYLTRAVRLLLERVRSLECMCDGERSLDPRLHDDDCWYVGMLERINLSGLASSAEAGC